MNSSNLSQLIEVLYNCHNLGTYTICFLRLCKSNDFYFEQSISCPKIKLVTKRQNKNYNLQEHDLVVFIRLRSQQINILNNIDYDTLHYRRLPLFSFRVTFRSTVTSRTSIYVIFYCV